MNSNTNNSKKNINNQSFKNIDIKKKWWYKWYYIRRELSRFNIG
jgi:hypothetical protein